MANTKVRMTGITANYRPGYGTKRRNLIRLFFSSAAEH
jgi:hypothetical protein